MRGTRTAITFALGMGLVVALGAEPVRQAAAAPTADQIFQLTKAWTVHLSFSREAWHRLTPVPNGPTGMGFLAAEGMRNGLSGVRGIEFEYVHADLEFDDRPFKDVAVRYKGNGTYPSGQKFNKPSLKIDLNKYVKGQKVGGLSTLNLHSNVIDASLMNEELAYQVYRDAGALAPRTAYARVYVTVPGLHARTYLGLYGLVENVDTNFTASRFKVDGGAILKPVTFNPFTDLGPDWAAYHQIYDPKTDLTSAEQQRVIDLSRLVSRATDQDFAARIGDYVDLDAFATYMAVVVWFANPDTILQQGQNYYTFLHPTTRRLHFIAWDQDHSWGQFVPFRSVESQQQLNIERPWGASPMGGGPNNRFLARIFGLDAFRRPYLSKLLELTRTTAEPGRLSRQQDALGAAIAPLVRDEPNELRVSLFPKALGTEPFARPNNQAISVVPLKTFVRARHASVAAQLRSLGIQ